MFSQVLKKLIQRQDLDNSEMTEIFSQLMQNKFSDIQVASFLSLLSSKGETITELTVAASIMRQNSLKINSQSKTLLDTSGTGGDNSKTFNISTTTALVTSSCSIPVAKHGNRAISSRSGSADVLESLGVNIIIPPLSVEKCLREIGIGFLFAPKFHHAMKNIGPIRKELGIRTIFNIIGPLTNPAQANFQLVGVYKPNLTETIAHVLQNLGLKAALVVHGYDGLDEITLTTKTKVSELKNGEIKNYDIDPTEFGFKYCKASDLKGGDAETNAQIIKNIISGKLGPKRDIVLLNSAAALYIVGKVTSIKEGLKISAEAIDQGLTKNKLEELITYC